MSAQPKRAAQSAFVGSAVEYFDFTLFATASALFVGPVFFKPLGPGAATMAALLTFGLAFVARPFGAILFGHLGDRIGRRHSLVWTIALMGVATFGIGILPGYTTIGVAAPILLLLLRLLQGISAGGEQAGANSLTLEHAPEGKRGYYAAWTMQGTSLGTLLGKIVFLAILTLPPEAILSWGWRVPFLIAGPCSIIAWYIRKQVAEPDAFNPEEAPRVPVKVVLTGHWRSVIAVAAMTLIALGGAALNVYGLQFSKFQGTFSPKFYLTILILATILSMVVQPLWAIASDRWGRKRFFAGCSFAAAILGVAFLASIASGSKVLFIVGILAYMLAWSGANAIGASLYSEQFPTAIRYTGTALGTQLGMILVGFGPSLMVSLQDKSPTGWLGPGVVAAVFLAVAAIATLLTRETAHQPLEELAQQPAAHAN